MNNSKQARPNSNESAAFNRAPISPRASAREVFIVRLWRESRPSPVWVGQVQHIRTGRVVYVRGPKELVNYLQEQLDAPALGLEKKRGLK